MLYRITLETGNFEIIKDSIGGLTADRRLQAVLIAFAFGAFIEGAAGFGTPVAVAAAMLTGLGFSPFFAAAICMLANTAPVAFGSIGIPVVTLAGITGLPEAELSAWVGRICAPVSMFIPAYLILVMGGFRALKGVMPAALVCGVSFAIGAIPRVELHRAAARRHPCRSDCDPGVDRAVQGLAAERPFRDGRGDRSRASGQAPRLRANVARVVAVFAARGVRADLGQSMDVALSEHRLRFRSRGPACTTRSSGSRRSCRPRRPTPPCTTSTGWRRQAPRARSRLSPRHSCCASRSVSTSGSSAAVLNQLAFSLLTIACVLGLAYLMNYSGATVTLGLAFAATGALFPFFSGMLGWLGVFLTGSDTSANALFGNLQVVTANQLGFDPAIMAASNSSAGVMGKMISLQSIAVAVAATGMARAEEGKLFRFTLKHSVFLAAVLGILATIYAYA